MTESRSTCACSHRVMPKVWSVPRRFLCEAPACCRMFRLEPVLPSDGSVSARVALNRILSASSARLQRGRGGYDVFENADFGGRRARRRRVRPRWQRTSAASRIWAAVSPYPFLLPRPCRRSTPTLTGTSASGSAPTSRKARRLIVTLQDSIGDVTSGIGAEMPGISALHQFSD